MKFHPAQKFMALFMLDRNRIETKKGVMELEALRFAKSQLKRCVLPEAVLVLRPVNGRGEIKDGFIEYRWAVDRWCRVREDHLDKAA